MLVDEDQVCGQTQVGIGNGCLSSCFNILRLEIKTGTGKQGSGYPTRSRIYWSLRIVHFWCMRWWVWRLGVSKCSIDSMSLCASSFAQSMCFFSLLILTAWCLFMGTRLLPSPGRTNRCITVVLLATSLVPAPIAWCVEMVWLPRAAQGKVISWLDEISSRVQLLHDTDMFLRCWNPVMLQGSFWFSQAALRGVLDFAPANATFF